MSSSISPTTVEIRPQSGPQENFLENDADIAIYGGAAGGGKSWALLAEPLRHVDNPHFTAVIFRRTTPEIRNPGGLWDESSDLYPTIGAEGRETNLDWSFPGGAYVKLSGLEAETDLAGWQGAQICLIEFDELTTFSERMFWFLVSRNRSNCGIKPYIRASCNPDAESWVAKLVAWWIDEETGFPIPERAGVVRWFYRVAGELEWFDSADAAKRAHPDLAGKAEPKSFTFVAAKVHDNKILLAKNPEYLANLMALPHIEQQRFLEGNWKITNQAGEWPLSYFPQKIWFDEWPKTKWLCRVIVLDPSLGRTEKSDYSALVSLALDSEERLWCDADLQRRPPEKTIEDALDLFVAWPCEGIGVEANAMQELFGPLFRHRAAARKMTVPLFMIPNSVAKPLRIRRLGHPLKHDKLRFKSGSKGAKLLVSQLKTFPNCDHDDGPDALEMAKRLIAYLLRRPTESETREVIRLG